MTHLAAENLTWATGNHVAILRDVSFTVPRRQTLAICGANGAGKSTLLRLLYRFLRPSSGRVTIDGDDVWQLSARDAACRVATVLQEQPTDFALTVREMVALGRTPHRSGLIGASAYDKHVVEDTLNLVSLRRFADSPFNKLSGGERQKVMIARALVQETELLVLDEPTNHLDIRHQLELLTLLRGLGKTIILTLHDLTLAAEFADSVLTLHKGQLVAHGAARDVLTPETISRAFEVTARIDRSGPTPRYSYHL